MKIFDKIFCFFYLLHGFTPQAAIRMRCPCYFVFRLGSSHSSQVFNGIERNVLIRQMTTQKEHK
jgi:hypothetical protein